MQTVVDHLSDFPVTARIVTGDVLLREGSWRRNHASKHEARSDH
jgi:hypothetical protein